MVQAGLGLDAFVEGADALGAPLDASQVRQFDFYMRELATWNERTNLVAPSSLADAPALHFLDSLVAVPYLRRHGLYGARLIDVGSGAGFPGLPLKIALPRLRLVLLESTGKKAAFLRHVSTALALADVEVWAERAEDAGRQPRGRGRFDVSTARALAPLPVVLELTLPFLRVGGRLLAWRGADAVREAAACDGVARALGGALREVEHARVPGVRDRGHLVVVEKVEETDDRYPRRAGVPAKRPLHR